MDKVSPRTGDGIRLSFLPLAFALLLLLTSVPSARQLDPENCLFCHSLPWLAVEDDSVGVRNFHINEEVYANSVHGRLACRDCHTDVEKVPHERPVAKVNCGTACHVIDPYTGDAFSHHDTFEKVAQSVHGQKSGKPNDALKPVCKDCHHNSTYWQETPEIITKAEHKCKQCHTSFKGLDKALNHLSLHLSEDQYWRTKMDFDACVRCHSDDELRTDSLGVPLHETIVGGFLKSFHGRGFRFGDRRSPVCADCHGTHNIYPENDERSLIHASNRQQTCSTIGCHDGATASFSTQGSMHELYEGWQAKGLQWILWLYVFLILGLLGVMALHNLLDTLARYREVKRHPEKFEHNPKEKSHRIYFRMSRGERVSHILMFVSFSLLAITGAILWLPETYFSVGQDHTTLLIIRAWSHRIAAILITVIGCYHIYTTLFTARGRKLLGQMLPKPADVSLAWQNVRWMLRLRKDRPKFGYFSYQEKLEYWGFAWGSVVMTATGTILWFEHLGSKYIVDVSRLVHSLEAILAVGTIVIWHFWNVNWKPGRWPMAEDWITGSIDRHEMEEEHSGLLEELDDHNSHPFMEREKLVGEAKAGDRWITDGSKRRKVMRSTGIAILVLTSITCIFMGWSFTEYVKSLNPESMKPVAPETGLVQFDIALEKEDPSYRLASAHLDQDWLYGRFHPSNSIVRQDSLLRREECLLCHSILPHKRDIRIRADLNMHSRFMTCVVCHHEEAKNPQATHEWVDLRRFPEGDPGTPFGLTSHPLDDQENYNSYITLSTPEGPVYRDQTTERAIELKKRRAMMTHDELKKQADHSFHETLVPLDELRLACVDCHTRNGRVDFSALGFTAERIARLQTESLAASISDYDEFYLPPSH